MSINFKKATAFILIVLLALTIPMMPTQDNNSVAYAEDSVFEVDLSEITTNAAIKISEGSIWVNTRSALDTDYRFAGDAFDTKLMLEGKLGSTEATIDIGSEGTYIGNQLTVILSNTAIDHQVTGSQDDPASPIRIDGVKVRFELYGTENHITSASLYGSGIELKNEADLIITGPGILSSIMTEDGSKGSAIGGGYSKDGNIQTGNITVGAISGLSLKQSAGAGLGGGYTDGDNASIHTGSITVLGCTADISVDEGAGIGGGVTNGDAASVNTSYIGIINSEISADIERGVGVGGGLTEGQDSIIFTDLADIWISGFEINVGCGAGIGGGVTAEGNIDAGNIVIDNGSYAEIYTEQGACIGGGYAAGTDSLLGIIDVYMADSEIFLNAEEGAGIGCGYAADSGAIFKSGNISAANTTLNSNVISGAGIGGGFALGAASDVKLGHIIFEGNYATASAREGKDIGAGSVQSDSISVAGIYVSGGSVFAKNDTIDPQPFSADGRTAYKVTIPAIEGESESEFAIDLGGTEYYGLTSAGEHGEDFPVSASAFAYIPAKDTAYKNITVGDLQGKAEVVSDPSGLENTVLIYRPFEINVKSLNLDKDESKNISVKYISDKRWYNVSSDVSWKTSPAGIVSVDPAKGEEVTLTGISPGKTVLTAEAEGYASTLSVRVLPDKMPFIDVNSQFWGWDAIRYVFANDLMKGEKDDVFGPSDPMKRNMFITVIGRMEGISDGAAFTKFQDVPQSSYYANHVAWGYENKIIEGVDLRRFLPESSITREEAATIIMRYADYLGMELTDEGPGFIDIGEASDYAKENILKAQAAGIMIGIQHNKFEPRRAISRAEAAQMLMNFREIVLSISDE